MARHRHIPKDHDHDYDEYPTTAGLIRLICTSCGHVGIGLSDEGSSKEGLRHEEARSILEALASPSAPSPWPEPASG